MTSGRDVSDPVLARIMMCWSLLDPSQRLQCEVCRTDRGLELRCSRGEHREPIRGQLLENVAQGLELAAGSPSSNDELSSGGAGT